MTASSIYSNKQLTSGSPGNTGNLRHSYILSSLFPVKFIILLVLALMFSACDDRLVSEGVSQKQALKMVVLLNQAGLEAEAVSGRGSSALYSIKVSARDYPEAARILVENNLPQPEQKTVGELLETTGFLPQSRLIESMRLDRAKSLEIEEHFKGLPGVVDVRALLRSNSQANDLEKGLSLFVVRAEGDTLISKETLFKHLTAGFPALKGDNIVISLVEDESVTADAQANTGSAGKVVTSRVTGKEETVAFLWVWRVRPEQYAQAAGMVGLLFLVAGVVGGAFGFWYATLVRSRAQSEGSGVKVRLPSIPGQSKGQITVGPKNDIGWN